MQRQMILAFQAEHAQRVAAEQQVANERREPLLLPTPVVALELPLLEAAMARRGAAFVER